MKTILAATAATLFATSVSAADIYKDMGAGNSDLSSHRVASADVVASQPSIGSEVDRYQGFGNDNPDVFHSTGDGSRSGVTPSSDNQPIYVGPGYRF